jgi:hypothetical protein
MGVTGQALRGKSDRCQWKRGLCGPQKRSEIFGEETNLFSLLIIELRFLGCPAFSLFNTSNTLSQIISTTCGKLKLRFDFKITTYEPLKLM